jgi:hypothetical protein
MCFVRAVPAVRPEPHRADIALRQVEPGQLGPVHGQPPGGVGGRLDPAPVGPAAQSVVTHPDQVGRFLDPKYRHQQTLTQIRLKITHGGVSAVIMDRD